MNRHGTSLAGERHPAARLTKRQVQQLRERARTAAPASGWIERSRRRIRSGR